LPDFGKEIGGVRGHISMVCEFGAAVGRGGGRGYLSPPATLQRCNS
jgi:hypothetical protein